MAERTPGIGPVPEGLSEELTSFLAQMRRLVGTGIRNGALSAGGGGGSGSGGGSTIIIGGGGTGSGTDPDYTPPPTPTNFTGSAGLTYVFCETDPPTFTMGHGYLRTNIYGAKWPYTEAIGPTFTAAELVHQFTGQIGAFPSEPATRWCLWAKWETNDGIESVSPAGGAGGVVVETGQDVALLLELLTGQITESQLYQALGAKIEALNPEVIDQLAESLMQAVVALHAEAQHRADDVAREATSRAEALLDEAAARGAQITQVQTVLQAADTSLAQDITDLTAAVNTLDINTAAAIQLEAQTRADTDDAEALLREQLATRLDQADVETLATIESVRRTLSDADHAAAEQALTMVVTTHTTGKATSAAILEQAEIRSTEVSAEAIKRETLSVKLLGTTDPDSVDLQTLASGLLAEEKSARVDENAAAVQRLEVLEAKVDIPGGSSISSILTSYATLATLTSSQASQASTITAAYQAADAAVLTSAQAYVQTYAYAKSTVDSAEAAQTANLTTAFTNADTALLSTAQSWVQSYAYSKSQADAAIATQVDQVSVRLDSGGDVSNAIVNAQNTASAKNATFKQATAPTATRVGDTWIDTANGNLLKAWSGSAWVASDDQRIGTTASSVTTLQSQIAGTAGSELLSQIQAEATTRADQTGDLFAQWTVKTSVAGLISGFGLASTANNAAPSSMFGIQANQFYVAPPHQASSTAPTTNLFDGYVWLDTSVTPNVTRYRSGSSWVTTPPVLPFIIQTTPTTINGVSVPAGVYMDTAFLRNGTITNALIGTAAIDDAKIANLSAAKIIAGSIAVGAYIQSSNYVSNTSGWRIHGNGTAELQNAIVRGTVWATAGEFASTVRLGGATSFAAGNGIWQGLDGSTPKWRVGLENSKRIQWDGSELAIYGSANNKVMAVSGSTLMIDTPNFGIDTSGNARFSGDISGATGVFAGSLAAGVIDASTITGQNFTRDTPGTYTVVTMPYSGKVRWTMCGAGGGGGGGGSVGESGIAGLPGSPGVVSTGEVTAPEGAVVTVFIPSGGGGATSGGSVSSPPGGSAGGQAWISISGVGTWYANGGAGGGTSTSPAGGIAYTYRMLEYGDFGGVLVAPAGSAPPGIPGAYAGVRGLNGVDQNVLHLGLAGQASKLNGGNGYRGGGGGGGAPTRAWVGSRELYADPVDGEGGDGSPTSAGGNGGHGFAFIEIFNPNSVVLRNDFEAHKSTLGQPGSVGIANWQLVWSGSTSGNINAAANWGYGLYEAVYSNGAAPSIWITRSITEISAVQQYQVIGSYDGYGNPIYQTAFASLSAIYKALWAVVADL